MSYQVIIESNCTLVRIAVVEEGKMIRLNLEDQIQPSLQDSIVQGRVEKVVKNLQGVFVNFGQEKNGLLHLTQIPKCYEGKIQQGKKMPVQIKRENTGDKGHKLSANINIKGDKLICLPFEECIAFSKKIKDLEKKEWIRKIIANHNGSNYGFMVRTKASECEASALESEVKSLIERTDRLLQMQEAVMPGTVLWKEQPIYTQVIKEVLDRCEEVECITNNLDIKQDIEDYLQQIGETKQPIYKVMDKEENLFQIYSLEKSFESILKHKVWLKNGGNIVIDYTEAMTIIDVNSAKAIEGKNKRKAIVELNQLAVEEAIGQIVKRNLSGIIVIDLVDFVSREDREIIFKFAKQVLEDYKDKRTKVYPLTELDLLQVARTKEQLPYRSLLLENCKYCGENFKRLTPLFITFKIEQKLKHIALHTDMKKIFISVRKDLYEYVLDNELTSKFESIYGIKIILKVDNKIEELYDIKYCE